MSAYPEEEGRKAGITSVIFPNRFFDPIEASRLYQERLAEYLLADEVGFYQRARVFIYERHLFNRYWRSTSSQRKGDRLERPARRLVRPERKESKQTAGSREVESPRLDHG